MNTDFETEYVKDALQFAWDAWRKTISIKTSSKPSNLARVYANTLQAHRATLSRDDVTIQEAYKIVRSHLDRDLVKRIDSHVIDVTNDPIADNDTIVKAANDAVDFLQVRGLRSQIR